MVRSAAETEQIVQWAKFAPRGSRGLNNGGVDGRFGTIGAREFTETANRESLVLIQIETAQAVEEAEAIAAVVPGNRGAIAGILSSFLSLGTIALPILACSSYAKANRLRRDRVLLRAAAGGGTSDEYVELLRRELALPGVALDPEPLKRRQSSPGLACWPVDASTASRSPHPPRKR